MGLVWAVLFQWIDMVNNDILSHDNLVCVFCLTKHRLGVSESEL